MYQQRIHRIDHDEIVRLVPAGSRVLDLGCAEGDLLYRLTHERGVHGDGVEIDYHKVMACVRKGLSVYHGCIEEGLKLYEHKRFDYVVLSETLQVLEQPRVVLNKILEVGHRAIVSFPNFANWRLRCQLFFRGIMPTSELLPFAWHDTPNIHHCTIADFWQLCREDRIEIEASRFPGSPLAALSPNLLADIAIFVLKK